jgi:adenylylsulfate reductase subunit B
MTRCDGCGHCVDICPSDIMHIDENIRRAKNIEPNFCWECYSCVKACPNHAIDVRGYADFAPMGHSVRVRREEEKGTISWKIKFRNGTTKDFVSPITTKPWGNLFLNLLMETNLIKEKLILKDCTLSQKDLILMVSYQLFLKNRLKKEFTTNG